jgi:two-component system cell cycle response regulator
MVAPDPIATLLTLVERLAEDLTLEQSLAAVTDAALVLLPGDHASIRLVDESGDELVALARSGHGSETPSRAMRKGEGVAGWVLVNGRAAVVHDVRDDPRFLVMDLQGFDVRSLVSAPLLRRGHALGVLSVSSGQVGAFGEEHERLARLLASSSVRALEQARLERLAVTDDLTHAYNGRYLVPRLREEIERVKHGGASLSVAMLDLDHFKSANDTHGHAVGDRLLRVFADRVRDKTRRSDVLVRRGGEEFVLLLPATGSVQALALAERIRAALEEPIDVAHDVRVRQTVSIGVASWSASESADELVNRADVAMYEAKRAGRNRVVAAAEPGAFAKSNERATAEPSRVQTS